MLKKFKKLLAGILAGALLTTSVPCFADASMGLLAAASTQATVDGFWKLNENGTKLSPSDKAALEQSKAEKEEAIKNLLDKLSKLDESDPEYASTKKQLETAQEEAKVISGKLEGQAGYQYAYFPTVFVNIVWQASDGSCKANDTSVTIPGTYSYNVNSMNEYGVIDYMVSTLDIK